MDGLLGMEVCWWWAIHFLQWTSADSRLWPSCSGGLLLQAWFRLDLSLPIVQLYIGWDTEGIAFGKLLCPESRHLLWHHMEHTDYTQHTSQNCTHSNLIPLDTLRLLLSPSVSIKQPMGKAARYCSNPQQICSSLSVGVAAEVPCEV